MRPSLLFAAIALAGCIRSAPGPDLGDCAKEPKGNFTYGQIGIGTCLAGPADIEFYEADGRTWLAVTNANPYLTFDGGSLLLIDWDGIDLNADFNDLSEIEAHAIDLSEYVGGVGILEDRQQAIVTSRLSEGAANKVHNDLAYVIDLSDPTNMKIQDGQPFLRLKDDPQPVVVDEDEQLTYIGNLTDHSVAIIDHSGNQLEHIDVAPGTTVSEATFVDGDDSGTVAVVGDIVVEFPENLIDDLWTLTYVDGLARIWLPSISEEGDVGLARWTSGGFGYTPSALGVEIDPAFINGFDTVEDPYVFVTDGLPVMFFSSDQGIAIMPSLGAAGDWDANAATLVLRGANDWDATVHSPSLGASAGREALYYEGRSADGVSSVGIAFTEDGLNWLPFDEPVIDPALVLDETGAQRFLSIEDPYVRADPLANQLRMWVSLYDGVQWSIGLTESAAHDGFEWSEIEEVLSIPGGDAAAPVIEYQNDRYILWFAQGDGLSWTHATAWSYDGRNWVDITEIETAEPVYDPLSPPRIGTQVDNTGQWRIEGRDAGQFEALVVEGNRFIAVSSGFSIIVASGQDVLNDVVPSNRAKNGILPGSLLDIDGDEILYITEIGDDERSRIGALRRFDDTWVLVDSDLIPSGTGGNVSGVTHPVVHEQGGTYTMFYGARDRDGLIAIRRATSTDGLSFTPESGKVVNSDEDWDAVEQLPHFVEVTDNGRLRLWYGGSNGSRFNIGAATAADPTRRFQPDEGEFDPFQLGTGVPGSFDDTGVKDPVVFTDSEGGRHMFYAGFDGLVWHVGHATDDGNGGWIRRADPTTDQSILSMAGLLNSFSSHGVESPVITVNDDNSLDVLYAGFDGFTHRLGSGVGSGDAILYPTQRFGTPEDSFMFTTQHGRVGDSVIELAQDVENFVTLGIGMSSMALDSDRGFLYVPSKLATFIYVIDVRDDSSGVFDDFNYRDLEGLIRVETDLGLLGFHGVLIDDARDRLYLTSRNPDGIAIMDLTALEDNEVKETTNYVVPAALPLPSVSIDAGHDTIGLIGGAGMTLTEDGRYLLATHFRGNSLIAFDLEMGAYGEETEYLQNIGENPHIVQLSPDGRYAVVANYVGDIIGQTSHSTLAVVDADPNSTTFLEVLTWIGNI